MNRQHRRRNDRNRSRQTDPDTMLALIFRIVTGSTATLLKLLVSILVIGAVLVLGIHHIGPARVQIGPIGITTDPTPST